MCAYHHSLVPFTPVPLTVQNFGVLAGRVDAGQPSRICSARALFGRRRDGIARVQSDWPRRNRAVARAYRRISNGLSVRRLARWLYIERGAEDFARAAIAGFLAEILLFAGGLTWLSVFTHSWQGSLSGPLLVPVCRNNQSHDGCRIAVTLATVRGSVTQAVDSWSLKMTVVSENSKSAEAA